MSVSSDALTESAGVFHIGLGSNLNQPVLRLTEGLKALAASPGITLLAVSSFYTSAPIGYLDQPAFVNAVARIRSGLSPSQLLQTFLAIERQHGRIRDIPNGPRTLDLDVLLWSGGMFEDESLCLPHPRLHERAFVLHPLLEISPAIEIPGVGSAAGFRRRVIDQSIQQLVANPVGGA